MRELQIETGEIYHICNRSIGGEKIFSKSDFAGHFLETLFLVNTTDSRLLNWRREKLHSGILEFKGDRLADIYALVLMPDHFHILAKQLIDGGVAILCQRLCNSFARYYNLTSERKGRLFLGPYRAVHISNDAQAAHIFTYMHGNPLDLIVPEWREGGVKNWEKAEKFLKSYPWSSLGAYTDAKTHNFIKDIINKDFASDYFDKSDDYLLQIKDWSERQNEFGDDLPLLE